MRSNIGASVVAGLIAGVVFGIMMHVMTAPTPDGGRMPVIAMVGQIVGSPTVWSNTPRDKVPRIVGRSPGVVNFIARALIVVHSRRLEPAPRRCKAS
jgi:hypothetical protein